jgi:DNA-binding response OmpR family regulator
VNLPAVVSLAVPNAHSISGTSIADPMKILIVEDERKVAQFIERAFVEQNYTVGTAASCAEARDALAESPYDAVVLDLGLPDGTGLGC